MPIVKFDSIPETRARHFEDYDNLNNTQFTRRHAIQSTVQRIVPLLPPHPATSRVSRSPLILKLFTYKNLKQRKKEKKKTRTHGLVICLPTYLLDFARFVCVFGMLEICYIILQTFCFKYNKVDKLKTIKQTRKQTINQIK